VTRCWKVLPSGVPQVFFFDSSVEFQTLVAKVVRVDLRMTCCSPAPLQQEDGPCWHPPVQVPDIQGTEASVRDLPIDRGHMGGLGFPW